MADTNGKIVRTSIRMNGELHQRAADFVHELKRRNQKASIDWLIQHAVEDWLNQNDPATSAIRPPPVAFDPQLGPWVEILDEVFQSQHALAIEAAKKTLQALRELGLIARGRAPEAEDADVDQSVRDAARRILENLEETPQQEPRPVVKKRAG